MTSSDFPSLTLFLGIVLAVAVVVVAVGSSSVAAAAAAGEQGDAAFLLLVAGIAPLSLSLPSSAIGEGRDLRPIVGEREKNKRGFYRVGKTK